MAKRKTMTALEMQSALQAKGYSVEIYFRKEGGARISKINGVRYTGSKGNEAARQLLGVSLTKEQQKHLANIKQRKGVFGKKRKSSIPKDMINLQDKINREFKKQGKSARVRRSQIRYRISNDGEEAARAYLNRALLYAKGYTYYENIEGLIARLKNDYYLLSAREQSSLNRVIKGLEMIIMVNKKLKETDFQAILEAYYDWVSNHTISLKDFVSIALNYISKAE